MQPLEAIKKRGTIDVALYLQSIMREAEFIEEHRLIMNRWSRYLEANRQEHVTPHEFANQTGTNVTRLKAKSRLRE